MRLRELPFLTQLNLRLDPAGPAAEAVGETLGARAADPVQHRPSARGERDGAVARARRVAGGGPAGRAGATLEKSLRLALGTEAGAVVDLSAHRTTVELAR